MPVRLLIHAPTPASLERARSNARNLLKADPTAEVEIVANAAGARAVVEGPPTLAGETAPILCGNSLANQGLASPEGARVIEAAVLYIAQRQAEGWAYLRA